MAAGVYLLLARESKRPRVRAVVLVVAVSVVFVGGIIAGTSPVTRLPAPYDPGVSEVPYDPESRCRLRLGCQHLGARPPIHR